jgi:NTP pyrophosphatase (non-canonical NTP hydrolase)
MRNLPVNDMGLINPPLKNTACEQAIRKWGQEAQLDMAVEECSELAQALMKFRRHKKSDEWRRKVLEEAADVSIMLEQVVMIAGEPEEFEAIRDFKLRRLAGRIAQEGDRKNGRWSPLDPFSVCEL